MALVEALGEEDQGSIYAAEGTAAHYMAEQLLKGVDPSELVGKPAENGYLMTQEMLEFLL